MKRRIEIARSIKWETADEVRKNLEADFPDKEYQVRKMKGGYRVVERVDLDATD